MQEYALKLRKAEKLQEARLQRAESAGKRKGSKLPGIEKVHLFVSLKIILKPISA